MAQGGIVVGFDGSASSRAAVRWAAGEAADRGVPLTVVHVIDTPPWNLLAVGGPVAAVPDEPSLRQRQGAQRVIDEALAEIDRGGGPRPQIHSQVFFAAPVPTLVQVSADALMLVVGRRGTGLLRRLLLGSVSTGVLHHAQCPVAVIHADAASAAERSALPVVLGVDGSPVSEVATALAFEEAARRGVELVALHAWSDAEVLDYVEFDWPAIRPDAELTLAERLAGWQEHYPDVVVRRVVEPHQPTAHLIALAESAQLVVVGSHGRGGFTGMLLGSVSAAVAQTSPAPVIVARK
ncbi:universal stress protein UspA [Mycolicibacillus koreensis]|nr:universal stress protein UspA [Mycolicibacillus koreensis]